MRIFVAGASGAIGQPLIAELIRRGHEVTGMTPSRGRGKEGRRFGGSGRPGERLRPICRRWAGSGGRSGRGFIDELTCRPKTLLK
jgi:2-alkyl-3-oxoalkanoate reductase